MVVIKYIFPLVILINAMSNKHIFIDSDNVLGKWRLFIFIVFCMFCCCCFVYLCGFLFCLFCSVFCFLFVFMLCFCFLFFFARLTCKLYMSLLTAIHQKLPRDEKTYLNKGNNKITELRTFLQRESQNS